MGIGFWKGKIDLKISKHNYSPGETIKGTLHLKLKKPTKARKVTIRLLGEEKVTRRRRDSQGRSRSSTRTYRICDVLIPLDGEREYSEDTFEFEVPIPKEVLQGRPDGVAGDVIGALEFMGGTRRRIIWHLIGNLDIPMGFDLSKKQDIVVQEG